eukprot:13630203-Alexandrium_andersonii.AAC.1
MSASLVGSEMCIRDRLCPELRRSIKRLSRARAHSDFDWSVAGFCTHVRTLANIRLRSTILG